MFVVVYTKSGHFDGMTNSLIDKTNTLLERDKWGLGRPFESLENAQAAFDKLLVDHGFMLANFATAAQARQPTKTAAECHADLLKIYPYPHSPVYHSLVGVS